jgi:hypothetical protein
MCNANNHFTVLGVLGAKLKVNSAREQLAYLGELVRSATEPCDLSNLR